MADGLHIEKTAHERAQIKETQLKQKKEQKRKSKWKTMPAKSNTSPILHRLQSWPCEPATIWPLASCRSPLD